MSLRSDCGGRVPARFLPLVPRRFDVIGNIAVLSLPDSLVPYAGAIAQALTTHRRSIRTVVRKVTKIEGANRVARFEIITGNSTVTTHRENGFSYRLDLADVFFAPRLVFERRRIASKIRTGERVLIPFAGTGPFVVPVAAAGGIVTAVEKNPAAFQFLKENIMDNGVAGRVTLICGNAIDASLLPATDYDRAIIPAPYGQDEVFDIFAQVVRPGGMIHLYAFKKKNEIPKLVEEYQSRDVSVQAFRRCGNVAPGVSRWAFDLCRAPI